MNADEYKRAALRDLGDDGARLGPLARRRSRRPRCRSASGCSASSRRARATPSSSSRPASATRAMRPPSSSASAAASSPRTSARRWSTSRTGAATSSGSRTSSTGSWTPRTSSSRTTPLTACSAASATCSCRTPDDGTRRDEARPPARRPPRARRVARVRAQPVDLDRRPHAPRARPRPAARAGRAGDVHDGARRARARAARGRRLRRCIRLEEIPVLFAYESLDEYIERAKDTGGIFARVWREAAGRRARGARVGVRRGVRAVRARRALRVPGRRARRRRELTDQAGLRYVVQVCTTS